MQTETRNPAPQAPKTDAEWISWVQETAGRGGGLNWLLNNAGFPAGFPDAARDEVERLERLVYPS